MIGSLRGALGYGTSSSSIVPLQRLTEEEPQRHNVIANRSYTLLAVIQQMQLVRPDLVWPELIGWPLKMHRKVRYRFDVTVVCE